MQSEVKTIGSSGQISLGKEHAGRTVVVEEMEAGVWLIRTAQLIPDNELWLHTPEARVLVDAALTESARTKRSATDLTAISRRIGRLR